MIMVSTPMSGDHHIIIALVGNWQRLLKVSVAESMISYACKIYCSSIITHYKQ